MLSLSRGGPTVWMSPQDAGAIDVHDNDWVECVNANGVLVGRARSSATGCPKGVVYVHHAQERTIDVPKSEATGRRGGIHNSVTRLLVKPTPPHRRLRAAVLHVQLPRPHRQPARHGRDGPQTVPGGDVLMRVMAQMAMVMNLDKCIGCHTCSVTCKQAWTNRAGTEYVWFNNVETRPGQGYPRRYEDQETWKGGWELDRRGNLKLKSGGRVNRLLGIFASPVQPELKDYYEPWTYDYQTLVEAPLGDDFPVARPKSLITGEDTKITWSANWDDNLGGASEMGHLDPIVRAGPSRVRGQGPVRARADLHVLPAADLRALPQPVVHGVLPLGRDLQARRGRHRPGRPGPVPWLAAVHHRLPVQEDLLQPQDRQGREVHVLLPADRGRACRRSARRPASGGCATSACSCTTPTASRSRGGHTGPR